MRLLEAVHDYKNHELKSTWGLFAAKKKKSIQDFIDFIETEIEKIRKASE